MSPAAGVLLALVVAFGVVIWVGWSEYQDAQVHKLVSRRMVDTTRKDEQVRRLLADPDAYFAEARARYRRGEH